MRISKSGFLPAAVTAFSGLTAALPVSAQQTGNVELIALRCGRVLDVVSGRTTQAVTILVRGERIESISTRDAPSGAPPNDAQIVDLSAMTCLPGLMDLNQDHGDRRGELGGRRSQAHGSYGGGAACSGR